MLETIVTELFGMLCTVPDSSRRRIVRRLASLPGVKPSAVAAVEKLVFYGLALVVVAVALQTVNIPIAIGLGFGAQNLFNNFMSGLILIIEQPIRVGDLIEVEGHRGHVADVGARCTRIHRADGVDLLVPNSRLLESTVINWTLSDRLIRTSVTVGFASGSPSVVVKQLLERAAREHPHVLRGEPVNVIFADFGDSALVFHVEFWTEIDAEYDKRIVESDIRCRIDDLAREAGLSIAFPQRDLHLESAKPIDVRVLAP